MNIANSIHVRVIYINIYPYIYIYPIIYSITSCIELPNEHAMYNLRTLFTSRLFRLSINVGRRK